MKKITEYTQLHADVVVIGGGLAGMMAAVSAARSGVKVILVQDRPVLGGNQSSEMRVGISGADCSGSATARYVRETGLLEEVWLEYMNRKSEYYTGFSVQDVVFWEFITKEPNIRLLLNTSAVSAETDSSGAITSIFATQPSTEKDFQIHGTIFIDASGDSRIAADAGADFRVGQEGKAEFGETMAPDEPGPGTMGSSIFFTAQRMDHKIPFTRPDWAYEYPEQLPYRSVEGETSMLSWKNRFNGFWWLEYGGTQDTIADNEEIRDELYKIVMGMWDHVKNKGDYGCDNFDIIWMNTMPAKRESRRLLGDHILCQSDVQNSVPFDDRVAYAGWNIDVHPPEGIYSKEPPCTSVRLTDVWNIPFRSLFSRNVPNLMMAGRNLSATRVALGSARVMATCALMGQAVGTAAGLCIKANATPRQILRSHIHQLQQTLLKNDCYLKDLKNEDPLDLARNAKVTASSEAALHMEQIGPFQPCDADSAQLIPLSGGKLERLQLYLQAARDTTVTLELYRAQRINQFPTQLLCTLTQPVTGTDPQWVSFDCSLDLGKDALVWVKLRANDHLQYAYRPEFTPLGARNILFQNGDWRHRKGSLTLQLSPESHPYRPENVISGIARPERWTNIWISDPAQPLPQYLELAFPQETVLNTVQLTFDTDLDTNIYIPKPYGVFGESVRPTCVRDYDILALREGKWVTVHQQRGNFQRHTVHHFDTITAKKIRIQVLATNGTDTARIYEVRCYNE